MNNNDDDDNLFFDEHDEFEKLDKIMDLLHQCLKETKMLDDIDNKMTIAIGSIINSLNDEDKKDYSKIILYASVVWLIASSLNLSLEGFSKVDKLKVMTMIKYNLNMMEQNISNQEEIPVNKKKVN